MDHDNRNDFADVLAEQLRRAPYLIASAVVHVLLVLVFAGFLLLKEDETAVPTIVAQAPPPPPEIEQPDPPKPDETPVEPIPIENPVVVPLPPTDVVAVAPLDAADNPSQTDAPFDARAWNSDLGLGSGSGGPPGGGGGGAPSTTEAAVQDALRWLADHQAPSGYWDADEFMLMDRYADQPASTGPGNPVVDVGLTGLALLAFEARGIGPNSANSEHEARYAANVSAGVNWLREVQRDDGLYGDEVGNPTLYNHAIATMAMGEAYRLTLHSPTLKPSLRRATAVIVNAQNPYGAWRYKLEPNGDQDSSITGWMVFALKTADAEGIPVDRSSYAGAETWFATMEDKNTGRVGYEWNAGAGSLPSRPSIYIDKFPAEKSESLTAVALLCRIFMTDSGAVQRWQDHPQYESLRKQAELVAAKPPRWDEEDGSIDLYYWYYGTFAMNQWGGRAWKDWEKALGKALIPNQRRENERDNFHGSWNPVGVWCHEGGRVYSTAICALMLEVYYRYARVLGAR